MEQNKDEKVVIIVRGVPGAGKTWLLTKNYPQAFVCSANHHFTDAQGKYNFKKEELPKAHSQCKDRFNQAIESNQPLIAVDNTNTTLREFSDYIRIAKENGYSVRVIRIEADKEIAFNRNIHGLPRFTFDNMFNRFEYYQGEEVIKN